MRVSGAEHIPRHGPAIIAANHKSFWDAFFLALPIRRQVAVFPEGISVHDPGNRTALSQWRLRPLKRAKTARGHAPSHSVLRVASRLRDCRQPWGGGTSGCPAAGAGGVFGVTPGTSAAPPARARA